MVWPATCYVKQAGLKLIEFPCLCPKTAGIKGVHHNTLLKTNFYSDKFTGSTVQRWVGVSLEIRVQKKGQTYKSLIWVPQPSHNLVSPVSKDHTKAFSIGTGMSGLVEDRACWEQAFCPHVQVLLRGEHTHRQVLGPGLLVSNGGNGDGQ